MHNNYRYKHHDLLEASFTNLACDKLIMKIVQCSSIHRFIHYTQISCIEKTFDIWINVLTNEI